MNAYDANLFHSFWNDVQSGSIQPSDADRRSAVRNAKWLCKMHDKPWESKFVNVYMTLAMQRDPGSRRRITLDDLGERTATRIIKTSTIKEFCVQPKVSMHDVPPSLRPYQVDKGTLLDAGSNPGNVDAWYFSMNCPVTLLKNDVVKV